MKKLIGTFCLTFAVFAGGVGTSSGADYEKGLNAFLAGDYTTALGEFRPLAESGHAIAQFNLGVLYDKGLGVPQDFEIALMWYTLAADQGYASAQTALGEMHNKGQGVPQDNRIAARWYTLAAEQGHAGAQYSLGRMYYEAEDQDGKRRILSATSE